MTEENYIYRTSQTLLRNQFPGNEKLQIPIIPKFQVKEDDLNDLLLIGFDKTHSEDLKHLDRMVHFFLYDNRFERVWKNPDIDIEKLAQYRAVLSPDFSMYLEMAPVMQLYNVFRNRWCGAYWASKRIRVVSTVNWGDESTFDFCFEGIKKGSVVAVSTYMASEHDHRKDQKEWFLTGYKEMLLRIVPEKNICYNTPFQEMQGDIVYVDYERSSWRYLNYEQKTAHSNDLDCYKIGGAKQKIYDTIEMYMVGKGVGSAYGGEWKPSKPEDQRLIGNPGEIKVTYQKDGTKIETKIGADGRAVSERHHTSAPNAKYHSNPHDHKIDWTTPRYGIPNFGKPINYWGDVPEFKSYGEMSIMDFLGNSILVDNFKTISEFKECIIRGGEPVFDWNGDRYGVCLIDGGYCIAHTNGSCEKKYSSPDEVLEYIAGENRLRDIITKVNVISRSI